MVEDRSKLIEFLKKFNLKSDGVLFNQISLFGRVLSEDNSYHNLILDSFFYKSIRNLKDENEVCNFFERGKFYYKNYVIQKEDLGFYLYLYPVNFKSLKLNFNNKNITLVDSYIKKNYAKFTERRSSYLKYVCVDEFDFNKLKDLDILGSDDKFLIIRDENTGFVSNYLVKYDVLTDKSLKKDVLRIPIPYVKNFNTVYTV